MAVTTSPKFSSPAPSASSAAVAWAARVSRVSRAVARLREEALKVAVLMSFSTICAARAGSMGR